MKQMGPISLILATRNTHKTSEFHKLLGDQFEIRDLSRLTVQAIEETGKTFEENATLKAIQVSKDQQDLVFADDSGLEVDSLGGSPGIFSARYARKTATDAANIDKLLRELIGQKNRAARFRCVIALAHHGELIATFKGEIEGSIADRARGTRGFGYDPVFLPIGSDETFAEIPAVLKNRISHRAQAAMALRDFLLQIQ